jgi:adenylate cyclase
MVVARNSTFIYKGKAVDIKQVSREQGVRYVLEGSVRKAGNRVRINAQLIDATTGHHMWAERYDRLLEDIFAVQDEITKEVTIALDVRLSSGEQALMWSSGTAILEAWELVRQAMDLINHNAYGASPKALLLCQRALELDPEYAMAWSVKGLTYHQMADEGNRHDDEKNPDAGLQSAIECGQKALELDPSCADAYSLLSICHLSNGEHDQAIAMSRKSIVLAPSHAENLAISAIVHNKSGQPERGLELIKKAMRFCPVYPLWFLWALGMAYRYANQTEAAISAFELATSRGLSYISAHVSLASTYGELNRLEDAKKTVSEILQQNPDFSITRYMAGLSYKNPQDMKRFEEGLRKVGLPD